MRLALATTAALLGGCYRPSAEDACRVLCPTGECPEGAPCMAGRCVPTGGSCEDVPGDGRFDAFEPGDAFRSPDAVIDAAGTLTCAAMITMVGAAYHSGSDFTMNRARTRAALLTHDSTTDTDVISIAEGSSVDASNATFVETIAPSGLITELSKPRMTPDGNTIIATAKNSNGDPFLVFSTRSITNGQWSALGVLRLRNASGIPIASTLSLVAGTPSEQSPRRMPVWLGGTAFVEFEEIAENTWQQRATLDTSLLGAFVFLRDPSFTPDGLRLVFLGQMAGSQVAMFTATRGAIGAPFNTAVPLFDDTAASEASPFLAAECDTLFYDDTNASTVMKAR